MHSCVAGVYYYYYYCLFADYFLLELFLLYLLHEADLLDDLLPLDELFLLLFFSLAAA